MWAFLLPAYNGQHDTDLQKGTWVGEMLFLSPSLSWLPLIFAKMYIAQNSNTKRIKLFPAASPNIYHTSLCEVFCAQYPLEYKGLNCLDLTETDWEQGPNET